MMMQEHIIDAGAPGSGSPLRSGPLTSMTAMVGGAGGVNDTVLQVGSISENMVNY